MLTPPTTNWRPSLYYRLKPNQKLQEIVFAKFSFPWRKGYFAAGWYMYSENNFIKRISYLVLICWINYFWVALPSAFFEISAQHDSRVNHRSVFCLELSLQMLFWFHFLIILHFIFSCVLKNKWKRSRCVFNTTVFFAQNCPGPRAIAPVTRGPCAGNLFQWTILFKRISYCSSYLLIEYFLSGFTKCVFEISA